MMKVSLKYLIVITGFVCAAYSIQTDKVGAGVAAAGAFIAYALIEIQDLKMINDEEEKEGDH
jgi:mannose/fructose/N-acetylgalactosamine-specific phosphotransferase system component IIC